MTLKTLTTSLIAAALVLSAAVAAADYHGDRAQIETVLSTYEKALNASDTDAVMTLYADHGVFMAQHRMPNVGKEAVRAASIKFNHYEIALAAVGRSQRNYLISLIFMGVVLGALILFSLTV